MRVKSGEELWRVSSTLHRHKCLTHKSLHYECEEWRVFLKVAFYTSAACKWLKIRDLWAVGQFVRTNSICPCFYFNSIILSFLRSYTTLMQLSTDQARSRISLVLIFQTPDRNNINTIFSNIWLRVQRYHFFRYFLSWPDFVSSVGYFLFPQLAKLHFSWSIIYINKGKEKTEEFTDCSNIRCIESYFQKYSSPFTFIM